MLNPYRTPLSSECPSSGRVAGNVELRRWGFVVFATLLAAVPPLVILISRWLHVEASGIPLGGVFGVLFVMLPPLSLSAAWLVAISFYMRDRARPPLVLLLLLLPTLPHCLYLAPKCISFFRLATQTGRFPYSVWVLVDSVLWMPLSILIPLWFGKLVLTAVYADCGDDLRDLSDDVSRESRPPSLDVVRRPFPTVQ